MFARLAGLVFLCWQVNANAAFELETQKVTEKVYALVGEVGPRNVQNHALNNTMGFVITDEAVLLIGSGATPEGAR